jgi:hypothetical protein
MQLLNLPEVALLGRADQARSVSSAHEPRQAFRLSVRLNAGAQHLLQALRPQALQPRPLPEIGGDFVSINIACLDNLSDPELAALPVRYANGRDDDWMHAPAETGHL